LLHAIMHEITAVHRIFEEITLFNEPWLLQTLITSKM